MSQPYEPRFEVRMVRSILAKAEQDARRRVEEFLGPERAKLMREEIAEEERKLFFGAQQ